MKGNNTAALSQGELLEERASALERLDRYERKEGTLAHLMRCWRPGMDLSGVVRAELHDARCEQERARHDLDRANLELRRREEHQLELWAASQVEAA